LFSFLAAAAGTAVGAGTEGAESRKDECARRQSPAPCIHKNGDVVSAVGIVGVLRFGQDGRAQVGESKAMKIPRWLPASALTKTAKVKKERLQTTQRLGRQRAQEQAEDLSEQKNSVRQRRQTSSRA